MLKRYSEYIKENLHFDPKVGSKLEDIKKFFVSFLGSLTEQGLEIDFKFKHVNPKDTSGKIEVSCEIIVSNNSSSRREDALSITKKIKSLYKLIVDKCGSCLVNFNIDDLLNIDYTSVVSGFNIINMNKMGVIREKLTFTFNVGSFAPSDLYYIKLARLSQNDDFWYSFDGKVETLYARFDPFHKLFFNDETMIDKKFAFYDRLHGIKDYIKDRADFTEFISSLNYSWETVEPLISNNILNTVPRTRYKQFKSDAIKLYTKLVEKTVVSDLEDQIAVQKNKYIKSIITDFKYPVSVDRDYGKMIGVVEFTMHDDFFKKLAEVTARMDEIEKRKTHLYFSDAFYYVYGSVLQANQFDVSLRFNKPNITSKFNEELSKLN
jgi:hypothetical protein